MLKLKFIDLFRYFRQPGTPNSTSKSKDKKSGKRSSKSQNSNQNREDAVTLFNHSNIQELTSPPEQQKATFSTFRGSNGSVKSPSCKRGSDALDSYLKSHQVEPNANGVVLDGTDSNKSSEVDQSFVIDIQSKSYDGSLSATFLEVKNDISLLIKALEGSDAALDDKQRVPSGEEFTWCKDTLVAESRQFVTDSKLLVSSATQSKDKLVSKLNISMHTLAKMVHQCHRTMMSMTSVGQGHELSARVKDVTLAYQSTVIASHAAVGSPLHDDSIKTLMKQATNLAAILSSLMRTLKTVDNR